MTSITMDALNRNRFLGFATGRVQALLMALEDGRSRWQRNRGTAAEPPQYFSSELADFDISSADIGRHAEESGQECQREEEFRFALDRYAADYQRHHAMRCR